jgi:hypothetical protein
MDTRLAHLENHVAALSGNEILTVRRRRKEAVQLFGAGFEQPLEDHVSGCAGFLLFQHIGNNIRAKAAGFSAFLEIPAAGWPDGAIWQPGR